MPRPRRAAEGGLIDHALNRADARTAIFDRDDDCAAFERVLAQAVARSDMRLLAYCILPDQFHLLLRPRADGDLSGIMRRLTMTHTRRRHAHRHAAGTGHLHQGRFKSFPVQSDGHLLTVCRYVERDAPRADLVGRAQGWRWCSLRPRAGEEALPALAPWPPEVPRGWTTRVDRAFGPREEEALVRSIRRGRPFGSESWQASVAARLGLESLFRPRGRPRKTNGS